MKEATKNSRKNKIREKRFWNFVVQLESLSGSP